MSVENLKTVQPNEVEKIMDDSAYRLRREGCILLKDDKCPDPRVLNCGDCFFAQADHRTLVQLLGARGVFDKSITAPNGPARSIQTTAYLKSGGVVHFVHRSGMVQITSDPSGVIDTSV